MLVQVYVCAPQTSIGLEWQVIGPGLLLELLLKHGEVIDPFPLRCHGEKVGTK